MLYSPPLLLLASVRCFRSSAAVLRPRGARHHLVYLAKELAVVRESPQWLGIRSLTSCMEKGDAREDGP